jgi:hypothetical protein
MSLNKIKERLRVKPVLVTKTQRPRVVVGVPVTIAYSQTGTAITLQTEGAIERIDIDRDELMDKLRRAGIVRVFQQNDLPDRTRAAVPESVGLPNDSAKKKGTKLKVKLKSVSRLEEEGESGQVSELYDNNKRSTAKPKRGFAEIAREEWADAGKTAITKAPPLKTDTHEVRVPGYYMNNRTKFVNFINSYFSEYRDDVLNEALTISCDDMEGKGKDDAEFKLLIHQKVVRDYLNLHTPYRGLLLFHGLGSGKTCSSIAIAEGMKSTKRVIVMTPASLQRNYIEEIKKCGDVLFKREQHWEWVPLNKANTEMIDERSPSLGISKAYIKKRKGVWLVDPAKPSNLDTLAPKQVMALDEQIDEMIRAKYRFINYNGLRREKLRAMTNDYDVNIFSNSVVIIDEAHNFISRITNKLKKEKSVVHDSDGKVEKQPIALALVMYEMLLAAEDVRIVMLTGTPMINYPNELGILFNILRGYIKTWNFQLQPTQGYKTTNDKIESLFANEKHMDYFEFSKNNVLTVTRNPFGFIAASSNSGTKGTQKKSVQADTDQPPLSDTDFRNRTLRILEQGDIPVNRGKTEVQLYKTLPDDTATFNDTFLGENNQVKNVDLFKKRILGLTSYFRSAQEGLMPRYNPLTDYVVIKIPMSDYQLGLYESVRSAERKEDSKKRTKQPKKDKDGLFEEPSSTYRIFSRLYCNFVMPLPPGRPLPRDNQLEDSYKKTLNEGDKKGSNELEGAEGGEEEEGDEIMEKNADATYQERIVSALAHLRDHGREVFSPAGLEKYSPKFMHMYDNIADPDHTGLHLVYSQFRTLEGIGIFKLLLDHRGYTQFKIKKGMDGVWTLNIADEDRGKPTYALYTGTESSEEKEMIRNIYNSDWNPNLPITQTLRDIANNNHLGEIIKVLMITASGSEGINLRSTRFVHIMEPYWHPTRKDQVIGRARRICSHKALPEDMQDIRVFVYLMTLTDEQINTLVTKDMKLHDKSKLKYKIGPEREETDYRVVTSDEALFEISTIKEGIITGLTKLIKEASIDCATYAKRGNAEQVQCVQYGEPRDIDMTYVPDITKQPNDTVQHQNEVTIKWRGSPYEFRGKQYIYRQMDKHTANLYDVESYYQALDGNGAEPQLMAVEEKRGDKFIVREVV